MFASASVDSLWMIPAENAIMSKGNLVVLIPFYGQTTYAGYMAPWSMGVSIKSALFFRSADRERRVSRR